LLPAGVGGDAGLAQTGHELTAPGDEVLKREILGLILMSRPGPLAETALVRGLAEGDVHLWIVGSVDLDLVQMEKRRAWQAAAYVAGHSAIERDYERLAVGVAIEGRARMLVGGGPSLTVGGDPDG